MRKLASVQVVNAVEPIPGADAIERLRVLGWWVVAKAGEEDATKVFYLGTMIASTLLVSLIRATIERHPELTDGTRPPSAVRMVT